MKYWHPVCSMRHSTWQLTGGGGGGLRLKEREGAGQCGKHLPTRLATVREMVWGGGGGGYKTATAAVGVGKERLGVADSCRWGGGVPPRQGFGGSRVSAKEGPTHQPMHRRPRNIPRRLSYSVYRRK